MSQTNGSRRGWVTSAAALVLMVSGAALIGSSIASQRRVPEPPPFASSGPPAGSMVGPPRSMSSEIEATLPRSKPVALDIPSIDVHSDLQELGQTSDGALETPAPGPLYDTAGWYRYSPTPGSMGPSVILGHVDSAANGPSVFFRLGELRPGDRVSVARADGSVAVFVVEEVRRYSKDAFPTGRVYSDIDHAGLRILTCGGAFDNSTGHYLDNIVIFASLVGSTRTDKGGEPKAGS